jgi:hypothetical protein
VVTAKARERNPAQFEAAGIGAPDSTLAEAKFLPLKDMGQMLIGVYQSLFPAAAALGIADQARGRSIQGRHDRGRVRRALLLPSPPF